MRLDGPLTHDQQRRRGVGHLICCNVSMGNIHMTTTSVCRKYDEVCCLIGDGTNQTPSDISVPEDKAADSDAPLGHLAADAV